MNIVVIGAGYVGLVTGACFAELGNDVTCIDVDQHKIKQLKKNILPFYEPGLDAIIRANTLAKRLAFAHTLKELSYEPEVIFIAVGTPEKEDGSADMQYVLNAAQTIGQHIQQYCTVVDKSTVPVGMADLVKKTIQHELKKRQLQIEVDIVSNPEFLREGAAIEDFMHPDRIIIGLNADKAKKIMEKLYLPIMRNPEKIFFMAIKDAEMTKYAANAMLATKISFMNEIALLCEHLDVDIDNVRLGIGSDNRIGNHYINPGCGYGGSCFPKDVRALIQMAKKQNIDPLILRSVEERNNQQKLCLAEKIIRIFGKDLSNITIGLWGLAFKPETDDMREASSLSLINYLLKHHARVQAYDPIAIPKASRIFPPSLRLHFVKDQYEALCNADALVLVTEWKPFCYPDLSKMKKLMRQHIIVDGRNQFNPQQMQEAQFTYYGIGRGKQIMALPSLLEENI